MLFRKVLIVLLFVGTLAHAGAQVTFVIESLPTTTPNDDTVFITGSFNSWQVDDPAYMLRKQPDGRLAITLPITNDRPLEYKFTRGSWLKVETDAQNLHTPNRYYHPNPPHHEKVYVHIANWLDLGGAEGASFAVFYYFAVAIQGMFLLFIGYRVSRKSTFKHRIFIIVNGLMVLLYSGLVGYHFATLVQQAYLIVLLKVILFAWGPCLFAFVRGFESDVLPKRLYLHFLPLIFMTVLGSAKMLDIEAFYFLGTRFHPFINYENVLVFGAGILWNLAYFIKLSPGMAYSSVYGSKTDVHALFVKLFLKLHVLAYVGLLVNLLLLYLAVSTKFIIDFEMVFIALSVVVFFQALFIWKYPEVLRERSPHLSIENEEELKNTINRFLREEEPYKNPDLNIELLSKALDIKPYMLSKVLNECFQKNFRDFVNGYRVAEFIRLANSGKLDNYTYLALAHEVGFNSKSTFNLAFKKVTGQNPREYFKEREAVVGSSGE